MEQSKSFRQTVINIALPITAQSMLLASFSIIDQIMTGQLGSVNVAGIGLGGKFSSIYSVVLAAIASAAGIMIAQYMGKNDDREVSKSFFLNLLLAVGFAIGFLALCQILPFRLMSLYSKDIYTVTAAANYLRILSFGFCPMAVTQILSTLLRCMEVAKLPLYAGILSMLVNTGLNYLLIFGNFGFPEMGIEGAAWATVISLYAGCLCTILFYYFQHQKGRISLHMNISLEKKQRIQYLGIVTPILLCEFIWSAGENVYAMIYGRMGTESCAAITLTNPIQALIIGALNGLGAAAGILTGRRLGRGEYKKAYGEAKVFLTYGLEFSVILSLLIIAGRQYYTQLFQIEEEVRQMASGVLIAFALAAPVKVLNMILGGGILRSGGKTKYILAVDFVGPWVFGIPFGLAAAFVFHLPIPLVYFAISLEELVRLVLSMVIFKKKVWMESL